MGKRGPTLGVKYQKTIEAEAIREYWRARLAEEQEPLFQAMLDKAKGCAIIDKKDDTGERIYDLPPDPQAFKVLVEHSIGKPPDKHEITGPKGGAFVLTGFTFIKPTDQTDYEQNLREGSNEGGGGHEEQTGEDIPVRGEDSGGGQG